LSKLFGISEKKFNEILNNKELMEKILKKMEKENSRFNISSTPTFVINDKHVIAGSLKYNEFVKKLKDFELLN
jgi:predicted DsbA family dithiol-disulfide isomerase